MLACYAVFHTDHGIPGITPQFPPNFSFPSLLHFSLLNFFIFFFFDFISVIVHQVTCNNKKVISLILIVFKCDWLRDHFFKNKLLLFRVA